MSQTVLPFKLEEDDKDTNITSFAGLPLYYELFRKFRLKKIISESLKIKDKGYKECEMIEIILGLLIAGGDCMEDVNLLKADKGLQKLIKQSGLPVAKTIERFLKKFHQEQKKPDGYDAWVPYENKALKSLAKINTTLVQKLIKISGLKTVTIECDATAVFSTKEEALMTYKRERGYMPVIGSIAELGLVIADEFRDGNVPPAYKVKEFFMKCFARLPITVEEVKTRLDGAYYEHDFIQYLKLMNVSFTITAKKSDSIIEWIEAIKEEEWQTLKDKSGINTDREYIEMPWAGAGGSQADMKKRVYRYLITRKKNWQPELFENEEEAKKKNKERYEVIATNMEDLADELIIWHYGRGGTIEQIHDRIKNDLGGGRLPSAKFGANAAWWRLNCMAWNMVRALQIHALPEDFKNCHLKKLRLWLFNIAGRVIQTGRQLILKLTKGHPSFEIYKEAREKIAALAFP